MKLWTRSCIALICLVFAQAVAAQAFPSRPVRIVVAFPPGGSNDIQARIVAQHMTEVWGQPVVVENRPGANTVIAADIVAKSAPDGYTLLVGASSTYTVNPSLYPKLSYTPGKDLIPVTMLGSHPLVVAVHPSVPATSTRELINLARAQPGKLNYGTPTITFHVMIETFAQMASVQMTRIPYKGSIPTVTALVAGDIQVVFLDPAPIIPHIRSGKVRALAVTSPARSASVPDLPTVAESGLPGYEAVLWNGMFAPGGTPRDVIGRIQVEAHRALHKPELRERLTSLGIEPIANPPEQFAEQLRAETARFAEVIRKGNIKAE